MIWFFFAFRPSFSNNRRSYEKGFSRSSEPKFKIFGKLLFHKGFIFSDVACLQPYSKMNLVSYIFEILITRVEQLQFVE